MPDLHAMPREHKPPPRRRLLQQFLLSCCLFFAILCACLIAALVLIGKHYHANGVPRTEQPASNSTPQEIANIRLPRNVKPSLYEITLDPDLVSGSFQGKINITLLIEQPTQNIILNSKGLTIGPVSFLGRLGKALEVQDVSVEETSETLRVVLREEVGAGVYNLLVNFGGSLVNKTGGFYLSRYKNAGKTRSIATSKFEPTYARQAFPCFDEPNMKAKFKVHLMKPKDGDYIALSNMPEIEEVDVDDNKVKVSFQESVEMSTYLSAFIVSDFKSTEDTITVENYPAIPFRVFATPAQVSKTEYAKKTGKAIMEFYLRYFDIAYPLPKLDMVAIPDFVSGAMEHWGLVTFRETALLYDDHISSSANKQRVATVVAHELAHSWFGNLVTMDWWNDLWLNEGFASYIEYKGVAAAEPEWQMMEQFPYEEMHGVMKLDATLSSHPIVQKVETPDQITEIFDSISYAKGASVLRMLENAITDDIFKQGVTNYLNKFKLGNAVTDDFLTELDELTHEDLDVKDFMGSFTVQMGYPIVQVKRTDGGFTLTQKRFLLDPNNEGKYPTDTKYKYKWTIPITYITAENKEPQLVWFKHNEESIKIDTPAEWIKINLNQVGYYRVNYEPDNWKKLSENFQTMSLGDQSHLLEESFKIAESAQLEYSVPLDLTKQLKSETRYVPWVVAGSALDTLKGYLTSSEKLPQFKEYVVKLVTPAYQHYTWKEQQDEGHLTKRARVRVLDLACTMGHKGCLDEAKKTFDEWLEGKMTLSQDLRSLVYTFGMENATPEEWNKVWDKMIVEIDAGEKNRLAAGLACIRDKDQLKQLIDSAKDETYIRKQDYFSLMSQISANPDGTDLVWNYVRENWQKLVDRFTLNDRYLGTLIPSITKTFSTIERKNEMIKFFTDNPNAGAGAAARKQALETVENNIKWLEKNKEAVEKWIEENKDQN